MNNYDRYQNYSEKKYNKKNISYFLMKKQANQILIPYIKKIKNKNVLEVGPGYGYYTKYLVNNGNTVKGLDINPELGQNIGIEIIRGQAAQLSTYIKEKYDYIVSFFMTEYLDFSEITDFISQSLKQLNSDGIFVTTIITNKGLGWLYIKLARIKGIEKYCYSEKQIRKIVDENSNITITPLNTILGIPFASLVQISINKKNKSI